MPRYESSHRTLSVELLEDRQMMHAAPISVDSVVMPEGLISPTSPIACPIDHDQECDADPIDVDFGPDPMPCSLVQDLFASDEDSWQAHELAGLAYCVAAAMSRPILARANVVRPSAI